MHAVIPDSLPPYGLAHQALCPWDLPGKNTGVGCHFLLQGIFPTQGSNPHLLLRRQILYAKPLGDPQVQKNEIGPFLYNILLFSHQVMSDSFVTPWTVACQLPLSIGFPRQEDWSGLPFPSPGDLPDPGSNPNLRLGRWILYLRATWEACTVLFLVAQSCLTL